MYSEPESQVEYMEKFDYFLSVTVAEAFGTENSFQADRFAIFLFPGHVRKYGIKAGLRLGLEPRDAAILTALTTGGIHQRTNEGSEEVGVKDANEMHAVIGTFLESHTKNLKATNDLPRRFYDIFLEDF